MKKIFMILFSLFFVSCAKVNYQEKPEVPQSSPTYYKVVNFANHATVLDDEDLLSSYYFTSSMVLNFDYYLYGYTYASNPVKPNLLVYLNNVLICSYTYITNKYLSNCPADLVVNAFDVIKIYNLPRSQTVSIRFSYKAL